MPEEKSENSSGKFAFLIPAGERRGFVASCSNSALRYRKQPSRSIWSVTANHLPKPGGHSFSSLESQARYITRPALAMDALQKLEDGNLALETPPDPRTGATLLTLDPLEWIHRLTAHIPDPGCHGQRYYGAYSNRARMTPSSDVGDPAADAHPEKDNSDFSREARSTWARLLKKVFEVDPLVCTCGARMQIVSFITDPRVVDRILRHRKSERCKARDPFEPRAPPRPPGSLPVIIPSSP
jgi:hypothetical protein